MAMGREEEANQAAMEREEEPNQAAIAMDREEELNQAAIAMDREEELNQAAMAMDKKKKESNKRCSGLGWSARFRSPITLTAELGVRPPQQW
jgi:hypothetical protein